MRVIDAWAPSSLDVGHKVIILIWRKVIFVKNCLLSLNALMASPEVPKAMQDILYIDYWLLRRY